MPTIYKITKRGEQFDERMRKTISKEVNNVVDELIEKMITFGKNKKGYKLQKRK